MTVIFADGNAFADVQGRPIFSQALSRGPLTPMARSVGRIHGLSWTLISFALSLHPSAAASAEKLPPLWGYGIKTCDQFVRAADGDEKGVDPMVLEYGRYEDWLTGFVSGLNLATGQDVLKGADIETALRRIRAHCRGHLKDDFFNATMDLVRMLSGLR